jgi:predicted peptidase
MSSLSRAGLTAFAVSILLFASCGWAIGTGLRSGGSDSSDAIDETFANADRPVVQTGTDGDYEYLLPWNYDKGWNVGRSYPLIVGLHGSGGSHFMPCIAGNDAQMKAYPCFFLAPTNASGWGSSAAWVRDEVETFIKEYRIDPDRLYIVGFSMGGSGSYEYANLSYDEHKRIYAGIVRCAGQSQTELRSQIAGLTSVWYHIGLEDDAARVTVAEQAYQWYKAFLKNASAAETTERDSIDSFPRFTKTLLQGGTEIFKKSEYAGMGHDCGPPFDDPAVLEWLFAQRLANRR